MNGDCFSFRDTDLIFVELSSLEDLLSLIIFVKFNIYGNKLAVIILLGEIIHGS